MRFVKPLLCTALLFSGSALAWGQNGHRIIGEIAQNHLSEPAKKAILEITDGVPLARLTTWPDEMRSNPDWAHASPWHYVSIDDGKTLAQMKRNPKGDVLVALERFEKELKNKSLSKEAQWQALAFYSHFLGDLHQPLHVGHTHDKGGNTIKVKWFGQETNLHSIWDTKLIEHKQLSYSEYTSFLPISAKEKEQWLVGSHTQWALESKQLRNQAYEFDKPRYNDKKGNIAGYSYVFKHTPLIEQRLKQAGIRLAEKLNQIFTTK